MPLISSPYKFFGLTLVKANLAGGWGRTSSSTLSLELVRDNAAGDYPAPVLPHQPCYFELGGLYFGGFLQKWGVNTSPNANPIYEAIIVDPREALEAVELILASYNGSTGGMSNLWNLYGYWENQSFGLSGVNDSGMPWTQLALAVNTICSQATDTVYGGPINYYGSRYSVDLSEMPTPPAGYRVGGPSINLLDLIDQVCVDTGYDFSVDLIGTTIKVRTTSRNVSPPLGTIANIIANNPNNVVRAQDGLEGRNEITSSFLVGGQYTELHTTTAIYSFWGYDVNNQPILGTPTTYTFQDKSNPKRNLLTVATETMTLNAGPVADILGAVSYNCSTLELQIAAYNSATWFTFIQNHRPDIQNLISSPFANNEVANVFGFQVPLQPVKANIINDAPANLKAIAAAATNFDFQERAHRLYEFVRSHAQEYYGKKFLVAIPDVSAVTDAETGVVQYSLEPTEAAYQALGAASLGLSEFNSDIFRTPDGLFTCFVNFSNVSNADLGKINPTTTALQGISLYLSAQVDRRIVFSGVNPMALITLSEPVFARLRDPSGDLSLIAAAFQKTEAATRELIKGGIGGTLPIKIAPATFKPTTASIPLKSNTLRYGPWYAQGANGKVQYAVDDSLVPWNFGGFAAMNIAGAARVSTAVAQSAVVESGLIELPGLPTASLGQSLETGGPLITGINISYSTQGVTTSYSFQSFTPRFGVVNKTLDRRLQRINAIQNETRKNLHQFQARALQSATTINQAIAGNVTNRLMKALRKESPYEVFLGQVYRDTDNTGLVRVAASIAESDEALGLLPEEADEAYNNTSLASVSALIRPYTTATVSPTSGLLPVWTAPSGYPSTMGLHSANLNPLASGHDVELGLWGGTYQGLSTYRRIYEESTVRGVCLKGPVVVAGWGVDIEGNAVPSTGSGWVANYKRRSDLWKVGPVDSRWDNYRGVWTSHDNIWGRVTNPIDPISGGRLEWYDGGTWRSMFVYPTASTTVASGTYGFALYSAPHNRWYMSPIPEAPSGISYGYASATGYGLVSLADQTLGSGLKTMQSVRASENLYVGEYPHNYLYGNYYQIGRQTEGATGTGLWLEFNVNSGPHIYTDGMRVTARAYGNGSYPATRFAVQIAGGNIYEGKTGTDSIGNQFKGGLVTSIYTSSLPYASTGSITSAGLTMATDRILGRDTTGTGAIEELSLGSRMTLTGGVLDCAVESAGSTGDVQVADGAGGFAALSKPTIGNYLYSPAAGTDALIIDQLVVQIQELASALETAGVVTT